jgi:hypothetical protein
MVLAPRNGLCLVSVYYPGLAAVRQVPNLRCNGQKMWVLNANELESNELLLLDLQFNT